MSGEPKESVRELLAALHAERVATWPPEQLQINIDQRRELVATADRASFVKAGDVVQPFTLPEGDGDAVALEGLLANGPVVLVFFRFAGCPACNIALPYYQRQLQPGLQALGASLVAISPQVPEKLVEIKRRHGLTFQVASDLDNALGRRFGITFHANAASRLASLAKGSTLGDTTGTGTWELPMPTVIVIGEGRVVRYADVAPDWLARTEAEPVIAAVRSLSFAAAV